MTYEPNTPAARAIQRICRRLLEDLLNGQHEVVLIPAPDPQHSMHKIRAVQYQSADWYRKFAAEFTSCRGIGRKRMKRPRTYIKRLDVEDTLRQIIVGEITRHIIAERIFRFIEMERSNHKSAKRQRQEIERNPVDWYALGIYF